MGVSPDSFQRYGWLSRRVTLSREDEPSKTRTMTGRSKPTDLVEPEIQDTAAAGEFELRLEDPVHQNSQILSNDGNGSLLVFSQSSKVFQQNLKVFIFIKSPTVERLDSESVSISSSRLSLSSSSSGHEHEDLPRLSLDSDKPSPNPFAPCRNINPNPTRAGRSRIRRDSSRSRGLSVDSPRMISSGRTVFQSLERSSSSPSSFNGGPKIIQRGMKRSYSGNVRITPVLNVPACSLRGSSKSGSVFGLFSSSRQKTANGGSTGKARQCNSCRC
ncbi:protein RRNAD1-like [Hibiscus syriacus]|uniref:Protein RRNAD1-like n=1 Tax=Hibiscus syriacus TaxID=106335 RepID=A0A6A3AF14_HIBSY|nr:protein RRNAD1-like [Hibiscus syriacus]